MDTLTDSELYTYLAEIEREDDELAEKDESAQLNIATLDEIAGTPSEERDTNCAVTTIRGKAQRESIIKRKAFSQNNISLPARIPEAHLKLLISLLVEPHTKLIEEYRNYINNRLGKALLREMPAPIRRCWKQYRHSIKTCPGFRYVAQIGDKVQRPFVFYATPEIPYFFKQHTERDVLIANNSKTVAVIDKAIGRYQTYMRNKSKREVYFGTYLIRNNINTYFNLLKARPLMFELLYNKLFPNDRLTDNADEIVNS